MSNPQIKIKRSSVAGKIPTADQLPLGELAANTYDGKLFASKNVGIGTTVFTVNPWTVGVGTNTYNTYFTEGNVGIGNTLPTSKLSVTGDASISGILTVDQVYTSNNGNGTNIRIGDDLWLGDINVANTIRLSGAQNSDRAFIVFGNSNTVALGRTGSAALYYDGDFTVAGVVTATTFSGQINSSSGTITTLSGTTASYGTINVTTGNIVTGVITNAQGTNLNYSGISTLGSVLSGNINSSGVVTATSFVGSGANLTSLNATQLTSGTVPGARITSSGGDFTVGANLYVNGVLSVGGTSIILNAAQLKINDRDITLGVTTDALGNDISNDNTANHGGIAIASTVGTPIINIPTDVVNNDLATYKQIMWIKQGHYSGLGTDAWVLNYGVSIGNTATVQNGSRLTVGAGFTVYENYIDLQSLRSVNINNSGITTLSGGLNASQGADLARLRVTGITTLGQVNVTGLSNAGISTLGNAIADTLVVTGFSSLGATSGSLLSISGVSTLSGGVSATQGIDAARLRVTGITTLGQANITGLSNAGVSTLGNATASTLNVSGISTLSTVSLTAVDVTSTTTTTTTTAATAIVSISASSYRSAVFQIQAVEGTNYNMTTINVLHDGIETYMTEYGTINQPVGIATFGTDISGGSLRLLAYPASINSTTFKVAVTALDI